MKLHKLALYETLQLSTLSAPIADLVETCPENFEHKEMLVIRNMR